MNSHKTWSISLGDWGGIHIRLHSLFLLFAAFTMYLAWQVDGDRLESAKIAAASMGILLVSVLLHEIGHYLAALKLGGSGNELVLGPLGGLSSMRPPLDPLAEAGMHLAGPAVNLIVCLFTGLLVVGSRAELSPLLNPLSPGSLFAARDYGWLVGCKMTFWINWVLVLVNLLPAYPFDGGRALRAALLSFWPHRGPRHASATVAAIAKLTAFALVVAAILLMVRKEGLDQNLELAWFAILLLAIFLYFSAKQEAEQFIDPPDAETPFEYDFSQGYTSLERSSSQPTDEVVSPVQRWLAQRKEARLQRQKEVEADEEARVDDILGRLHADGIDSLSPEDRMLLDRVSARYRRER